VNYIHSRAIIFVDINLDSRRVKRKLPRNNLKRFGLFIYFFSEIWLDSRPQIRGLACFQLLKLQCRFPSVERGQPVYIYYLKYEIVLCPLLVVSFFCCLLLKMCVCICMYVCVRARVCMYVCVCVFESACKRSYTRTLILSVV